MRRGALGAATGAALLVLAALAACPHAHNPGQWRQAACGWARRAEAQAAAWWAAHRPAALGAAGRPGGLPSPMAVTLELPNHRLLELREDETLESLVAKLLQEQVGAGRGQKRAHVRKLPGILLRPCWRAEGRRGCQPSISTCWASLARKLHQRWHGGPAPALVLSSAPDCPPLSRPLPRCPCRPASSPQPSSWCPWRG